MIQNLYELWSTVSSFFEPTSTQSYQEIRLKNYAELSQIYPLEIRVGVPQKTLEEAAKQYQEPNCVAADIFFFRHEGKTVCLGTIPACAQNVLDYQAEHNVDMLDLDFVTSGSCMVDCC